MKLTILGSGMIVRDFLSMVGELPDIELTAIVGTERSHEQTLQLKEQYQIGAAYTDFERCLEEVTSDTVYVALPNHLHFAYAKKALEKGKNVICEKPFTLTLAQFLELKEMALEKELVLVEAITNQHLENYHQIKQNIAALGKLKIMECNYSQYSSRYDAFKEGTILPAFNPKMGGGALTDINIYNIHFVVGLLGKPEEVTYLANIERGIDTSGVLLMDYLDTKVVCIGAKDSTSAIRSTIQGTDGSIIINGPTSLLTDVEKQLKGQESQSIVTSNQYHRLYQEFKEFERMITEHDMRAVKEQLAHSQLVMEVLELAIKDAGIVLG